MIATTNFSSKHFFKPLTKAVVEPKKRTAATDELVQMIKSHSERGFTVLYDNYSNALYGILMKIVKRTDVADDLLQETFVKIWKNIDRFDNTKGTLFTWMLNIARNQAIDYLRSPACKNQLQNMSIDLFLLHQDYTSNSNTHHSDLDFKDFKTKALQIDQKYAEVIDMIFFFGCTHQQTAELLKLPLGTVKTRARKGLSMLKTLYQQ